MTFSRQPQKTRQRKHFCCVWRSDQTSHQAPTAAQAHHTSAHAQPHVVTPWQREPHHTSARAEAEFVKFSLPCLMTHRDLGNFKGKDMCQWFQEKEVDDRGTNVEIALSRQASRKWSEAMWTSSGDSGVHLHLEIKAAHTFSPKTQPCSKEYSQFAPPAAPPHKKFKQSCYPLH